MIMSNGTNWHLLNIVYTLIRVGREYHLEQCMYVCMYVCMGETLRFKIYNGDTSDDEILFCWARRRRRRRTRGGKTEDGKVRNRKKRERDFGN